MNERSSDYYDPHPRVTIDKPIVLAGQIGSGAPAIGRGVAARTGLRFSEIDRMVEHGAGCSLAALAASEGIAIVEERADGALRRVVARPPFGLIVLEHAWPAGCGDVLREHAHLVNIDRPLEYLSARAESAPAWSSSDREALLSLAHTVLDAGMQHVHSVVSLLLESLERIAGAQRL